MTDPAQIILFIVIGILAVVLLALGVQVFFILRELRQTVSKANKVLDDTGAITESVSRPLSSLSSLAMGIKAGSSIMNFFKREKKVSHNKESENGKQ